MPPAVWAARISLRIWMHRKLQVSKFNFHNSNPNSVNEITNPSQHDFFWPGSPGKVPAAKDTLLSLRETLQITAVGIDVRRY